MNIKTLLVDHLQANATLTGLVANRFYPHLLPTDVTYPAIAYMRVDTVPQNTVDGTNDLARARFQFDIYGSNVSEVESISDALDEAMGASSADFKTLKLDERDLYENQLELYRISTDYSVWYSET